ncbi:MAG: adenylosuccinate synthase [Patescibacteria group bacterium]|jgi:adenylosuccinate synthase|nr:adenylosuccinate synthase [Patescibacteria group bacterium]
MELKNKDIREGGVGSLDVLIGLFYGDEGKGKIVQYLADGYDLVCRFNGGPNAGHTIYINNESVVLNTISCGIFSGPSLCADGMVVNPILLKEEIEKVIKYGADVKKNFYIGEGVHIILPTHQLLDKAEEIAKGDNKIGSTQMGICPVYRDKAGREGVRVGDILQSNFKDIYDKQVVKHTKILKELYNYDATVELATMTEQFFTAIEYIKEYKNNFVNSSAFVNDYLQKGKKILAEGAQATMLDISFGTYPFVTSSRTLASAAPSELGVGAQYTKNVYGVLKAYTTRVGGGPLATRVPEALESYLQEVAHERGARTGRPRNVAWLDLPTLRYAIALNGATSMVLTKLDIFDLMKEDLKICTHYMVDGVQKDTIDFNLVTESDKVVPVYTDFKNWQGQKSEGVNKYEDLPEQAREYLEFIEAQVGIPISIISVGAGKDDLILK